jgi:poly(3-hydroxyalkanoate) synthetase
LIASLCLSAGLALTGGGSALAASAVDLPASGGGKERVLYMAPANPVAALILFPGGDGHIKLGTDGTPAAGGNFLVRTRDAWVKQGMAVAIPDVPDNQRNLFNYRTTDDYAADIRQIIAYVRTQTKAPIWLVGTSQGTNAAVGGASRMTKGEIAGVVLTSTLTRQGGKPELKETVFQANLAAINVPVLILSHTNDQCNLTPPSDGASLKAALKGSPKVEMQTASGGLAPISPPCEAKAQHGFYGIEDQVVAQISGWIKANTR